MYNIEGIIDTRNWKRNLIKNLSVPSAIHPYSLAIEYMKDRWFLPKFKDDFFKTVYVNGKHVFADQRTFEEIKTRQVIKPAVAITPVVDSEWNRDMVDLVPGGLSVYHRPTRFHDNRLIRDDFNNIYLTMDFKQLQMQFDFHIRVATRAEQLNLLEHIRMACRIGSTQGEYIDMDCLLPKDIILSIAMDAGFELIKLSEDELEVKDTVEFVKYLNSHSRFPITYKFRGINGRKEYFVRLSKCYVHISCLDGINKDDGERINQLENNFHIDFSAIFQMPMPSILMYYSKNQHKINTNDLSTVGLYQLVLVEPPERNDRGWTKFVETDYVDETRHLTEIPFMDIFELLPPDARDIKDSVITVMKHNVELGLSPALFMEIQMFNDQHPVYFTVDWENYKMIIDEDMHSNVSKVAIYVDLGYVNNTIANINHLEDSKSRMD